MPFKNSWSTTLKGWEGKCPQPHCPEVRRIIKDTWNPKSKVYRKLKELAPQNEERTEAQK